MLVRSALVDGVGCLMLCFRFGWCCVVSLGKFGLGVACRFAGVTFGRFCGCFSWLVFVVI